MPCPKQTSPSVFFESVNTIGPYNSLEATVYTTGSGSLGVGVHLVGQEITSDLGSQIQRPMGQIYEEVEPAPRYRHSCLSPPTAHSDSSPGFYGAYS